MPGSPQFCSSSSRTISLLTAAVLFTMVFVPAWAQQKVPPTARQAATMPEFASHLARPTAGTAHNAKQHRRSPQDQTILYENGPLNGDYDAWTINFGYSTSNSFTLTSGALPMNLFDFYVWLYPGEQFQTVDWSVTSEPLGGGTVYGSGTAPVYDIFLYVNGYGYEIHQDIVASLNLSLDPGTYYLTLQNATTFQGNPVYWDENDGLGCQSAGCPSEAEENYIGTIGSETFDIANGSGICDSNQPVLASKAEPAHSVTAPPSPTQSFKVIYNFSGNTDGGQPNAGLTADAQGNLYGTTYAGGYWGGGAAFRLWQRGSAWLLNALRDFAGSQQADGANPLARIIFGADGTLYGTASNGGLVNDSCLGGCGTVFNLKPPASSCKTALCAWKETVLYQFQGFGGSYLDGSNPANGDLVFDSAGNMYGTTLSGGTSRQGTLYQLTPSGGSWTENLLYSFGYSPSGGKGAGSPPLAALRDGTGNFYVPTQYGTPCNSYIGTILYLTPSETGWQENLVWGFQGKDDGGLPFGGLISDQAGNLYGTTTSNGVGGGGTVFMLSPDWKLTVLYSFPGVYRGGPRASLVMDSSGNLYGTTYQDGLYGAGSVFKLTPSDGGWIFTSLYDFTASSDGANPISNVTIAPNGKLYGTTQNGGAYGRGVVWEITP